MKIFRSFTFTAIVSPRGVYGEQRTHLAEFYTKTICTFSILQLLSFVVVVVRVVYFGYFVLFNVPLFFRYLLVCLHTKETTTTTTTITTTADVNYKCTNVQLFACNYVRMDIHIHTYISVFVCFEWNSNVTLKT